jgi:hypothetical protein
VLKLTLVVSKYCGSGIPHDKGYLSSEQSFSSQYDRPIQQMKTQHRSLFGYGGDRLCKCSTTGGAITHREKAPAIA